MPTDGTDRSPASSSSSSSSFPFSFKFCLLVAGSAAAAATQLAYRRKATNPFKAAYATTWLTLGPAVILYASPDREDLEKKLKLRAPQGAAAPLSAETREAQLRALEGFAKKE